MIEPLTSMTLRGENDVVAARHRAKRLAELLRYDRQDATRIATAVSEIVRNAVSYAGGGRIDFGIDRRQRPATLTIVVSDEGPGIDSLDDVLQGRARTRPGAAMGLIGARRLMDDFDIDTRPKTGTRVRMVKRLPANANIEPASLAEVVAKLGTETAQDPYAALREQSRDLMLNLADLRERQLELERINNELEDTNRGVVALYSELDDKADQLREASEIKSKFLSYMSHEFRTPLNSIMALSRMLLDRLDGELSPEQERQVGYIRQSAESLTEMVDDLLDLAKVEAGRIDIRMAPFSIADLFAALRGTMRPLQTRDEVQLTFDVEPDLPVIDSDEAKVAQILRNFVSNALKFTVAGGVNVSARRVDGTVVIDVTDTGVGIAPEHLDLVFDEFGQVNGPLQKVSKGTGLGLPLSRKLAEVLGGTVGVRSGVNRGSTFTLTLPLGIPDQAGVARTPTRLLIVDDEERFRYIVRQLVRPDERFEVVEAVNGREGLALARATPPDVILLDLNMPELDGFGVLASLADDVALSHIPVIVVTSQRIDDQLRARLGPVASVFAKEQLSRDGILPVLQRVAEGRHEAGVRP